MTPAHGPRVGRTVAVVGLFLVALSVRLAFVQYTGGLHQPIGRHDPALYDRLATNLAAGRGYSIEDVFYSGGDRANPKLVATSFQPPAYPAFLAALYVLWGHSYATVRIAQCVVGALTVVLCVWLAARLYSRFAAWVAAALIAVYPYVAVSPVQLMAETQFTFLVVSTVCLLAVSIARPERKYMPILAGIVMALAILTKSIFVAFPPFLAFIAVAGTREKPFRGIIAVSVLTCLVVLSPWTMRNLRVHGKPILVSTGGGFNVAQGNNEWVSNNIHKAYLGEVGRLPPGQAMDPAAASFNEVDRERFFYRYALDYMIAHPFQTVRTMLYKALFYLAPGPLKYRGMKHITPSWPQAIGWVLLPFVLLGGVLVARMRSLPEKLPVILIAYFALFSLLTRYDNRYRAAVEPFSLMLAAVGFEWLYRGLRAALDRRGTDHAPRSA